MNQTIRDILGNAYSEMFWEIIRKSHVTVINRFGSTR